RNGRIVGWVPPPDGPGPRHDLVQVPRAQILEAFSGPDLDGHGNDGGASAHGADVSLGPRPVLRHPGPFLLCTGADRPPWSLPPFVWPDPAPIFQPNRPGPGSGMKAAVSTGQPGPEPVTSTDDTGESWRRRLTGQDRHPEAAVREEW